MGIKRLIHSAAKVPVHLFWVTVESLGGRGAQPDIKTVHAESLTEVDRYWGEHTVNSEPFKTAHESKKYLEWRSQIYPLFAEFMQIYEKHDDEVILDYGCGPGNDLVGFAINTRAKKIIGIDISEKALNLAGARLALHNIEPGRVELIHSADSVSKLPLDDKSVDYVHCAGVLQHTSSPESLLREFYRVLKPDSRACIMVYNRDSIWLHLYTAYQRIIVENAFPGMNADEAFSKNVDGTGCPLARCYRAQEFIAMCNEVGFRAEYVGGYLSDTELEALRRYGSEALHDERLAEEHKSFIRDLVTDERGFPLRNGKHVGVGGVYRLYKE
jgi:ubiquinone/menaquinone biosynthesis C-methylase UbiE